MKRWFGMLWKMFTDARALGRAERDLARSFEGIPRVDWSEFNRTVDRIARWNAELTKLLDAQDESIKAQKDTAAVREKLARGGRSGAGGDLSGNRSPSK